MGPMERRERERHPCCACCAFRLSVCGLLCIRSAKFEECSFSYKRTGLLGKELAGGRGTWTQCYSSAAWEPHMHSSLLAGRKGEWHAAPTGCLTSQ